MCCTVLAFAIVDVVYYKGSNGTTINIFVLNPYYNLNTYTEKHFLKHKYLLMDKGQ